jgi:hypothetical protein
VGEEEGERKKEKVRGERRRGRGRKKKTRHQTNEFGVRKLKEEICLIGET